MISSATSAANLYLNSALTSSTPELRSIYAASLTQMVQGHTVLIELSISKEWVKLYDKPIEQLKCAYDESKNVIE